MIICLITLCFSCATAQLFVLKPDTVVRPKGNFFLIRKWEFLIGLPLKKTVVKDSTNPGDCASPNEVFTECGTCEGTCDNPNPICTLECKPAGCYCIEQGFVRDKNGNCIKQEDCPVYNGFLSKLTNLAVQDSKTCNKRNEEFVECGSCEGTCENQKPLCSVGCRPSGCRCPLAKGFVRDSHGNCIKKEQCPSKDPCEKPNEEYAECGTCEVSCDNPSQLCTTECKPPGCYCKFSKGFVRDKYGNCIKKEDCPSQVDPDDKICKTKNEVYMECGTCEGSCENQYPICTMVCRPPGCRCPVSKGFVRDSKGNCIRREQCPSKNNTVDKTCKKKNEVYVECGTCEGSCENQQPICPLRCGPPGCTCPFARGFVRDKNGNCIKKQDCPAPVKICLEPNEEYAECGTCEVSCDNPSQICSSECKPPGCYCKYSKGFVRDKNGNCIKKEDCPAENKTCEKNEVHMECGTCEGTCDKPNPICLKICGPPGCRCPLSKGFVRNSKGKCIRLERCPDKNNGTGDGCKKNEVFVECGTCEGTCENPKPICSRRCGPPSCRCPLSKGFVRNSKGGCIKLENCPDKNSATGESCKKNEVFVQCATCEGTCENPNPACPKICKPAACLCPLSKGFVRNSKGRCIKKQNCPSKVDPVDKTCKKFNEVYVECRTCEGSCENPEPICTEECKPAGCLCPLSKGFVRDTNQNCIKKENCPKKPPVPECPRGMKPAPPNVVCIRAPCCVYDIGSSKPVLE